MVDADYRPFLTYTNLAVPYALNGNVDDAKTARAEASPFVSGVRFGVSSDRYPPNRDGRGAVAIDQEPRPSG